MQIFVRTDQTHVFQADASTRVEDVKAFVAAREGVPAEEAFVTHAGQLLDDSSLLSACGVQEEATLQVLLKLLGGGKKRKKKTYTKPKKIKHKHKKIKLRVLQFYKVGDGGKVERLRKTCPHCGPGIFMATMFDRVYCGKCHLTYTYDKSGGKA